MRIVANIPHPQCRITVFYMNGKYIVKAEKGNLEQSYKIPETDLLQGSEELPRIFDETMMESILRRFREMEKDLAEALER